MGLYSPKSSPPFPARRSRNGAGTMVSLPRVLLRGKDAVPKSPIPLPRPSFGRKFSWISPPSLLRSLDPSEPATFPQDCQESSRSCMDVDGSTAKCTRRCFPGPCGAWGSLLDRWGSSHHPYAASPDQCQPLSLGIQGKDGLFSQCCNLLYVYRAAELVGRYLLRK